MTRFKLNQLYIIGINRDYDNVKQYYIIDSYHDPTRPLFVPQEALSLDDDFLLRTQNPNSVANCFPRMNELVETPFYDPSRSVSTLHL